MMRAADGQRPRRVDPAAVGRVQDDPPVAELVAEPLDDQIAVGRDLPGGLALVVEVGDEVVGRLLAQTRRQSARSASFLGVRVEISRTNPPIASPSS